MKTATLVCAMLALCVPRLSRAQNNDDEQDEYSSSFGGEAGDDQGEAKQDRAQRPRSIAEAKQQGRGYKLGTSAVRGTGATGQDVHVVQPGDTLWDISARYFGDPWHWPELWSYNPEITNPHWIYPLDQIRLTPDALTQQQAMAQVTGGSGSGEGAGGGGPGVAEKSPSAGVLSGTETAPSVIVPRNAWKPGMVFLRDQGYLDQDTLKNAGQIVAGNEEHMLLSSSDQVYVKFGKDEDVQAGQSYTVFRTMPKTERVEKEHGTLVRIIGTVVIRSYDRDKHVARGLVTEALDPVERGLFVAKLDRRFDLISPKRNEANVVAHIIASVQPRTLLSYGNVVFLDVGEGHGIEPGNRFFVVRRGDNWLSSLGSPPTSVGNVAEVPRYNPSELPKEVIAELRVLKVRKTTTIAVITRSDLDVAMGETAEMRAGF